VDGIEPMAWLTDVLERVVSGRTRAIGLDELLPWHRKVEDAGGDEAAARGHGAILHLAAATVRSVCRAIIASSPVATTWTAMGLPGALMQGAPRAFASASSATPSHASRSHTAARTSGACSPIPAAKAKPSSPPSAPASRAIRNTNNSTASRRRVAAGKQGAHVAGDA